MSQNLVSQHPTDEQWAAADAAMQTIKDNLPALVALSATEVGASRRWATSRRRSAGSRWT
ncbi:MAG: hypothetical protein ACREPV_07015 [Lysobacter sp.]